MREFSSSLRKHYSQAHGICFRQSVRAQERRTDGKTWLDWHIYGEGVTKQERGTRCVTDSDTNENLMICDCRVRIKRRMNYWIKTSDAEKSIIGCRTSRKNILPWIYCYIHMNNFSNKLIDLPTKIFIVHGAEFSALRPPPSGPPGLMTKNDEINAAY